jgi:hypothetical protein
MPEQKVTSDEFDRKFNAGDDITDCIDWSQARRPGREQRAVTIRQLQATKQRLLEEAKRLDDTLAALRQS